MFCLWFCSTSLCFYVLRFHYNVFRYELIFIGLKANELTSFFISWNFSAFISLNVIFFSLFLEFWLDLCLNFLSYHPQILVSLPRIFVSLSAAFRCPLLAPSGMSSSCPLFSLLILSLAVSILLVKLWLCFSFLEILFNFVPI